MGKIIPILLPIILGSMASGSTKQAVDSISDQATDIARKAIAKIILGIFGATIFIFSLVKSLQYLELYLSSQFSSGQDIMISVYSSIVGLSLGGCAVMFFSRKKTPTLKGVEARDKESFDDISLNKLAMEFVSGFVDGIKEQKSSDIYRNDQRQSSAHFNGENKYRNQDTILN